MFPKKALGSGSSCAGPWADLSSPWSQCCRLHLPALPVCHSTGDMQPSPREQPRCMPAAPAGKQPFRRDPRTAEPQEHSMVTTKQRNPALPALTEATAAGKASPAMCEQAATAPLPAALCREQHSSPVTPSISWCFMATKY